MCLILEVKILTRKDACLQDCKSYVEWCCKNYAPSRLRVNNASEPVRPQEIWAAAQFWFVFLDHLQNRAWSCDLELWNVMNEIKYHPNQVLIVFGEHLNLYIIGAVVLTNSEISPKITNQYYRRIGFKDQDSFIQGSHDCTSTMHPISHLAVLLTKDWPAFAQTHTAQNLRLDFCGDSFSFFLQFYQQLKSMNQYEEIAEYFFTLM